MTHFKYKDCIHIKWTTRDRNENYIIPAFFIGYDRTDIDSCVIAMNKGVNKHDITDIRWKYIRDAEALDPDIQERADLLFDETHYYICYMPTRNLLTFKETLNILESHIHFYTEEQLVKLLAEEINDKDSL